MHLIHKDGTPVRVNDEVVSFRGEKMIVDMIEPPHCPESTGRVYVCPEGYHELTRGYFPSVFGLVWVGHADQLEDEE